MRLTFMGRGAAERLRLADKYVMVSITDPGSRPAALHDPACVAVLRLEFHDLDELPGFGGAFVLFTPEMAAQVAAFVEQWRDDVSRIVVHCEAGISRSCAVASALALYFTGDDTRERQSGCPNALVYKLMTEALKVEGAADVCAKGRAVRTMGHVWPGPVLEDDGRDPGGWSDGRG
ncbi:MAG: hypothetical protein ACHQ7N_12830 [Candidatus Methylomirabilales bacterium]